MEEANLPDAVVDDDVVAVSALFSLLFLFKFDCCLADTQLIDVPAPDVLVLFFDLNSFIFACDVLPDSGAR